MVSRLHVNKTSSKSIHFSNCGVVQTELIHSELNVVVKSGETQEDFPDSSEESECKSTDSEDLDDLDWHQELLRFSRIKIDEFTRYFQRKSRSFKIISTSISFLLLVCLVCMYMKFSSPPIFWKEDLSVILRKYPSLTASDRTAIIFTLHEVVENKNVDINGYMTRTILLGGMNADSMLRDLHRFLKTHFYSESREPIIVDGLTLRAPLHSAVEAGIRSFGHDLDVISLVGIEKMRWDAPLVLHAFCDPDANDIRNRVVLLSMEKSTKTKKACAENSFRTLTEKWSTTGGNADNIPPILSRIDFTICL